jgi:hypothetical protein
MASAPVVLLAGVVLALVCLGCLVAGDGIGDGQVGHQVAGCGAAPVPFAGRNADDVAGAGFPGLAAGWLMEAASFGGVDGLPGSVGVSCGAALPGEPGGAGTDAGGFPGAGDGLGCGPAWIRRSRERSVAALA